MRGIIRYTISLLFLHTYLSHVYVCAIFTCVIIYQINCVHTYDNVIICDVKGLFKCTGRDLLHITRNIYNLLTNIGNNPFHCPIYYQRAVCRTRSIPYDKNAIP